MKNQRSQILLAALLLLCSYSTRSLAQQERSAKEYLSTLDYYNYTNISLFQADEVATKHLLREYLQGSTQNGKMITDTKAYIVTERYQSGTEPFIFGAILISVTTTHQLYDNEYIKDALRHPLRVFDMDDLKKMSNVLPQSEAKSSIEVTSYKTMAEYLSVMIRQHPDDMMWQLQPPHSNYSNLYRPYKRSVSYFYDAESDFLREMAEGAAPPFGLHSYDMQQYQTAYSEERAKNPFAAFTLLHPHILSEATDVHICDSALIQELRTVLGKAGYRNLSSDIVATLHRGNCIRLQIGKIQLVGKTLADALPTELRNGKNNRLNVIKDIKVSERFDNKGILEDVTKPVVAYCHQIVRLGMREYLESLEHPYSTERKYNDAFLYSVDDSYSALNYNTLSSTYTNDSNITRKYISLATVAQAREAVLYARAGIKELRSYEYNKAHSNESPSSKKLVQPSDFTIEVDLNKYAPLASNESWAPGGFFGTWASLLFSGSTLLRIVQNDGNSDPNSPWSVNANTISIINAKYVGTSLLVSVRVKELPPKLPTEERILQGYIEFRAAVNRRPPNGVTMFEIRNVVVPIKQVYK